MGTPAWKERLSFLTPHYETAPVAGTDQHFYPISLGLAFRLRDIGKPLAKALSVLFADRSHDTGTVDRQVSSTQRDAQGNVIYDRETILEPISDKLAALRVEQRSKAIEDLIEAVTSDNNLGVLGDLIVDSLRDLFPREAKDNPKGLDLLKDPDVNMAVLRDMILGMAKANRQVFDPLLRAVEPLTAAAEKRLKAGL